MEGNPKNDSVGRIVRVWSCIGTKCSLTGWRGRANRVPSTPKRPVTETYHGVQVVDDYRWLEEVDDPAVRQWVQQQNRVARAHLDQLSVLKPLRARLKELMADPQPRYFELKSCGGMLFGLKDQPPAEQPSLIAMDSPDEPHAGRVLVDPLKLDSTGKTTIDFFAPSRDGKSVAVSISKGGSEDGTLYLYDATTGKRRGDVIPRSTFLPPAAAFPGVPTAAVFIMPACRMPVSVLRRI